MNQLNADSIGWKVEVMLPRAMIVDGVLANIGDQVIDKREAKLCKEARTHESESCE